jgi:predicted dehydrogenase
MYHEANTDELLASVNEIPPAQGETMLGVPFEKRDLVRIGFIGVGGRGFGILKEVLAVEGAQVTVISDVNEDNMLRAQKCVEEKGQPLPDIEKDWQQLCDREDVDLVYICSPWDFHTPQAIRVMERGKHAAVEVPCATTLADCWKLVDTSERTRRHCIILENCCYGQKEMMVLNLLQAGTLGTITHGEAAYIHDLRKTLLADKGEGLWRREPHKTRNGNLYPTHGLGPIAWYMNIHRGDRFTRLVSMSSISAALSEYRDNNSATDDPKREETYTCGDMNISLISTATGRTIILQHDVVTPRPYSRINLIQGTKGSFCDYPPRLYLDGSESHDWQPLDDTAMKKFEHSLWKEHGETAIKFGGHGGMDFILNYRLIETYHQGLAPDLNVYDAAAWSAPGPLSDISVKLGNIPLSFPDFTRGQWKQSRETI